MKFKPFFIHLNLGPGKLCKTDNARGFTAYISPVEDEDRKVSIQFAICAKHDQFCKRIGREQAMMAEKQIVNPRDVNIWLGEAATWIHGIDVNRSYPVINISRDYEYVFKYML